MDWQSYHRLSVIHDFMDDLEHTLPSLCTVGIIGQSIENRPIKLLKISNGNANNAAVWMDAGIHAREWIGPAVNTYVANYIARNFDKLPPSCTNKDWYFVPVVNPDGYEYSHTNNRMWRKNRAWVDGKCCGVDLNRNFSLGWGGRGSSNDPHHSFYRGTEPFSEPESAALKTVLLDARLPFKVYITLHAFGEVIIFPFACSEDLCPDYIRLLNGAAAMSRAIYQTNGNTYKVGISKDVMYRASGTSNDWCYGEVGIPYCYLIELRSKKHRFKLPQDEIEDTGNEILNCVIALMDFVDKYPLEQSSGDCKRRKAKIRYDINIRTIYFKTVNIWREDPSTMEVLVEGNRAAQIAGMLHEREIPYSVAVSDVEAMLDLEAGAGVVTMIPENCTTMDWSNYHRLDTVYKFMDNIAKEFPYLCTLYTIGRSIEGRRLIMMKISNGNCGNAGVWIDGAIHPREWVSTAVVTFLIDRLVRTFHEQPDCITNKDWYILPVLNPDGYEYTHTHDRMWRKNRAHYGECVGVDLNRNFSYGWGENGEEGSSEDPGNIFYRGPEPFSEPETTAVRNTIINADTTFKVFLSFHSYGEVIIFPWGYTSEPCPDYVELLEGGTAMAKGIYETHGHTYKVGSTKDLMYYAAGTSVDWSYGSANIPFSYMVELRSKKHRFLLPKEEIIYTAREVWNGVTRLMDFVDRRDKGTSTPTRR
ncbi:carboxypeptidase A1-like [Pectinophora gossypiella]|uniref:carboxypeptidase A1-like n=1 Tax=Pectinophora gossypiella TaxID=13191 RepID=UPI00214E3CA4|nr:carboxypeptidase A1-like [Pectinophora gossypiella]